MSQNSEKDLISKIKAMDIVKNSSLSYEKGSKTKR